MGGVSGRSVRRGLGDCLVLLVNCHLVPCCRTTASHARTAMACAGKSTVWDDLSPLLWASGSIVDFVVASFLVSELLGFVDAAMLLCLSGMPLQVVA